MPASAATNRILLAAPAPSSGAAPFRIHTGDLLGERFFQPLVERLAALLAAGQL
jgi:hypothetical protein